MITLKIKDFTTGELFETLKFDTINEMNNYAHNNYRIVRINVSRSNKVFNAYVEGRK